ncbi:MAG: adenosine deaminase [Anaerolineae bacterium]|nr:adenosine deaminase [Anaerolineae bacterium]
MGKSGVLNLQTEHLSDPLWLWAHSLPKIDLHRHLEGTLRLTTLMGLASDYGIELPSDDAGTLRPYVQMTEDSPDFQRFLEKFHVLRRFYTSKDAIQRITRAAIADAARDNVVYLELRFNPLALAQLQDFPLPDVVAWVMDAADEEQRETGTRTCLILQIPRDKSLDIADEIVDLAIANFGPLVRGIDLAGNEVDYPPQRFAAPFARAIEAGLYATAHAGEAMGAHSVQSAVSSLHPHRIGHGVRVVENSAVVRMLRKHNIVVEVCPTSNLHTGIVREFSRHPLVDLVNLGLQVTLNTDDPGVSDTTLTDEIVVSIRQIGLSKRHIYRLLRHSVEASFLPPEEKDTLRERIRTAIDHRPEAVAAFESASDAGSPSAA